jgi:polysaccharide pyruvyl transferase WcaK-like protein
MQIIVATGLNSGTAEYKNMGDVAMLQVAVARLSEMWPAAEIRVLTESASDLARFCPEAKPLPRAGCACWTGDKVLLGRLHGFLPTWVSAQLTVLKNVARPHFSEALDLLIRLRLSVYGKKGRLRDFVAFREAFNKCDLLVISGSGGFADSCREWNLSTLGTIQAALEHGIPVAMFGQGIGPLSDPLVLSLAKRILPKVSLIALRGTTDALPLLESLGVSPAQVLTTGDEAVELAYDARMNEPGDAIGINLRVATYSDVETDVVEAIGAVLQAFARQHGAPLLPIPIAFHEWAHDHKTIQRLVAGFDDETDGGLHLDTPQKLIEQTGRCRIVVTGAYHAAVFALAQGIPVVCLSNSSYYLAKFQGLQDLFGSGCAIVALDERDLARRLASAIESTWNSVEEKRSDLLQSALSQIEQGRGAYQKLRDLLSPERIERLQVLSQ